MPALDVSSRCFAGLGESPYRSFPACEGCAMNAIDQQRILAVRKSHELGLAWHAGTWQRADDWDPLWKADAVHALLVQRPDQREGCRQGSPEDAARDAIIDALAAYEETR